MNSELETYYHSASPQRNLDKQIKPFLQHLQESNINSLHQLKLRLQQLPSNDKPNSLSKTLPVFIHPVHAIPKLYSQKQEKIKHKRTSSLVKRNSYTLSPTPKSLQNSRERIHIVSPVSKVKKHLIQRINLDEMRQALFKQRRTLNRFQHFCEHIKEKDRTEFNRRLSQRTRENKGTIPSQQEFRSIEKNDEFSQRFRITTRRKFWRQNRITQSGEDPNTQMLNIKGIVKPVDKL